MNIKIRSINVDNKTLAPSLVVDLMVECYNRIEAPIYIAGVLSCSSKIITSLSENYIQRSETIRLLASNEHLEKQIKKENQLYYYNTELRGELNHTAIEYIETCRERHYDKSMNFRINIILRTIHTKVDHSKPNLGVNFLDIKTQDYSFNYKINQSEWINRYAQKLGIGKFLLIELAVPDIEKTSRFWIELLDRLNKNVQDIESSIKQGDWEKSILFLRQFYENIKIGDRKSGHQRFKEELTKLFKKDQHTQAGIDNFYDGIWKFFEFFSKYIHDKDTHGNIMPKAIPTKEDAYLGYALAIGLLNLISKKISK